jgi:antitoxin MazE
MTQLIKIGNSQGIRIPKPLVEQAQLDGKELKLQLVDGGLLIIPEKTARQGWKEAIAQTVAAKAHEEFDNDWLNVPLDSDDELVW